MAQAFFQNPPIPRLHPARDYTGAHKHVGVVRAHRRRVNPKPARRKLSRRQRDARSAKRQARKRQRPTAAQLRARAAFAAMVRQQAEARQARRGSALTSSRRTGGSTMARKKRRRSAARRRPVTVSRRRKHHRNPLRAHVRRARRRHRRNPVMAAGNVMSTVMQGVKDGFAVTLGRGVNNFVASKVPFGQTSAVGQGAVKLLTATLTGILLRKVTRSDRFAAFYVAGAYSDVIAGALKPLPVVGPMLSGVGSYYQPMLPASSAVGSYYRAPAAAPLLAGWPPHGGAMSTEFANESPSADDDFAVMG